MFRAAQQQSLPHLTHAPVSLSHVIIEYQQVAKRPLREPQRFDFHHLSTDRADVYSPLEDCFRCIVRIVAIPCPFVLDKKGDPTEILKPTWFEPSWFSIYVSWDWLRRGEVEKRNCSWRTATAEASCEQVVDYLKFKPEPFPSEQCDPIILEIR